MLIPKPLMIKLYVSTKHFIFYYGFLKIMKLSTILSSRLIFVDPMCFDKIAEIPTFN